MARIDNVFYYWEKIRGSTLARRAGYLIGGAIALEADLLQLVVVGAYRANGVNLNVPDTPHWLTGFMFLLAALLLVVDRYAPLARHSPNANDVDLYKKYTSVFTTNVVEFLRNHDFGGGYRSEYFDALAEINRWNGARYEFVDIRINEKWNDVRRAIRTMTHLLSQYSTLSNGNNRWMQMDWVGQDWHSKETREKVDRVNDAGTELTKFIDEFETLAREKEIAREQ